MMRHLFLAACLLLGACTGTFEEQPPIVILIAHQDETRDRGQLSLYDASVLSNSQSFDDRRPFVSRDLPGESLAVDFDVVDRRLDRERLVVLSRELDDSLNYLHYLSFYNLDGIDILQPDSFQTTREAIDLATISRDNLAVFPETLCPQRVRLENVETANEGYLVLLNDAEACGGISEDNGLLVLDLSTESWLSFAATIQSENVLGQAMALDQRDNRIFALTSFLGEVRLRSLSLPELSPLSFELDVPISPSQLRDLALFDNRLAVLTDNRIFYSSDLDAGAELDFLATTDDSEKFVTDDVLRDQRLYILSDNRLSVHESFNDDNEQSRIISDTADGTIDANAFMYLVAEDRVQRFDTLIYDGSFSSSFTSVLLPELHEPVFVTWSFAQFSTDP